MAALRKISQLAALAMMIVSFGLLVTFLSHSNDVLRPSTGAAHHTLTALIGFCVLVSFASLAYAQCMARVFIIKEQLVIQATLVVMALAMLPVDVDALVIDNDAKTPFWDLLVTLSRECGFTLFVLLSNGYLGWYWSGILKHEDIYKLWYKNGIVLSAVLLFYLSFYIPPLAYIDRTLEHRSNFHGTASIIESMDGSKSLLVDSKAFKLDRSEESALDDIFAYMKRGWRMQHIAVFGIGTGEINCYRKPWRREYDYFERNPEIVELIELSGHVNHLKTCNTPYNVLIGDPLQNIQKQPQNRYDLLLIDAFHSKTAPKHLISMHALSLYRAKMKENAFIAINFGPSHAKEYLSTAPMLQKQDMFGTWGLLELDKQQRTFFQKRGWQ